MDTFGLIEEENHTESSVPESILETLLDIDLRPLECERLPGFQNKKDQKREVGGRGWLGPPQGVDKMRQARLNSFYKTALFKN